MNVKWILIFLVALPILSGCVKNNPNPSWIEVNAWSLLQNDDLIGVEGELTHNFTDAWVYVNDKILGVFEIPFKIPVLESGNCNIKIYPAIRNNGISAKKSIYPFVEHYEINADLIQNQTLIIHPTTKYKSISQFWIEDFEDPSIGIFTDPNSSTSMTAASDLQYLKWGNFYGIANLNTTDTTWVAYTENMVLPKGQDVYMEIDYYNTNSVVTGVYAISATSQVNNQNIQINKQDPATVKWKKIYIDLKEIVSFSAGAEYFKQTFQAKLDPGDTEGLIIFDNIKVVHF